MRYLICLLGFGLLSHPAFSQMDLGVKLGANLSSASNIEFLLDGGSSVVLNDANRFGYQYGIWWSAPVGAKHLFLRSELLYIQKSWDLGGSSTDDLYTQFHYLSLPIIIQYQRSNFRIGAGPELSFLADQSIRLDGENFGDSALIDEKKLELGINLDLQYKWERWQLSLRYSLDLSPFMALNLTNANGEPLTNDAPLKHRALQLSVGYTLIDNTGPKN